MTTARNRTGLVYICGSGHSGSTLLEMLLAGHPNMVAVGELQNLHHQLSIGRVCSCGKLPRDCHRWQAIAKIILQKTGVDIVRSPFAFRVSRERPHSISDKAIRFWNRLCSYAHFRYSWASAVGIDHLVVAGHKMMDNNRLVFDAVRSLAGVDIVVDSSKDYVRMREIHDGCPSHTAKVIYLCRDGRGCVWSSVKRKMGTVSGIAVSWASNQRRTRAMLAGVPCDDQTLVRYEELCSNVEATLKRLCRFLEVEFADAMLQLAPAEHHTIAGNQIRVQRRMTIRCDQDWRENLTPRDLQIFERIAGPENRRLGYTD